MKNLALGVIFSFVLAFAPTVNAAIVSAKGVAEKNLPDGDKKKKKKECSASEKKDCCASKKDKDCKKGEKKSCGEQKTETPAQ